MKKLFSTLAFTISCYILHAQDSIPLYTKGVPNSIKSQERENQNDRGVSGIWVTKVSDPTLTLFMPPAGLSNGTAVLICPGGGYAGLAITKEGYNVAKELNKFGVTAFVLKNRLPDDKLMIDKTIGPLQDAQRGLQIIRQRAKEWNIDVNKVGIMGFSAGGHLASTTGTHFNRTVIDNKADINLRPDFMVLVYPVISFSDSLTHLGSRTNLIGAKPSADLVKLYSNELQITPRTPPTLLIHSGDDKTVKVGNSIRFYEALQANGVLAEMVIYPKGGHGFGINNTTTTDNWIERCRDWMLSNNWL